MNEKTKLLASKALDTAVPYTWTTLDHEQVHVLLACHAELIVRECASMARVYQSHKYDFTGDSELDEFMLKHFGVEE